MMSHMDDRFTKLCEISTPKEEKEPNPDDPFGPLLEVAQNMVENGALPPQPVKDVFVKEVPRSGGVDGTIETHIFVPEGSRPHPGVLWMHGGGFCIQNFVESAYRRLCNTANAVIVVPKYRLAPQHKFPAASNDCLDTYKWMANNAEKLNIDSSRLFLTGESAGGGLTTSIAVQLRDLKFSPSPAGQMPLFPFISTRVNTPSYVAMGHGHHWLERSALVLMWQLYQSRPSDINNPAFTAFATSSYENLAPSLTIVGGADPLLDDGIIYGANLKEAGVDSTTVTYADMPHVFYQFDAIFPTEADQMYAQMARFIKTVGNSPSKL